VNLGVVVDDEDMDWTSHGFEWLSHRGAPVASLLLSSQDSEPFLIGKTSIAGSGVVKHRHLVSI
jgi:hypothetical protein